MRFQHPDRRPAVVTGASSGIGAAAALALAAAGCPIALGARRVDRCAEVAERIRAAGGEAVVHALDVTDPDSVKAFAEQSTRSLGDIEVVVSNAGGLAVGAVHEVDTDEFGREIDVNLMGAHRLVRAFVPAMVGRRRGDIVFVSSDVARRARPFTSAYTASKWGLEGMAHAMQMELEGTGVRASIVRPGPTRSEMGTGFSAEEFEFLIAKWQVWGHARHPRALRASAIADAIVSVVSAPRGVHLNAVEISPEASVVDPEEP
ncbi:SDR family oxidoreductase [Kutzneria sp. NPDC052558]|uniref:SDR family oxidoreductase n=1 Tax=Kutzneria sp. NPDC052558 TaxID=3364121 RepID=UPI0037C67B5E